jgi:CBS domain-containing protein
VTVTSRPVSRAADGLATFLAAQPPFDSLSASELAAVVDAARVTDFERGELVLDAFNDRTGEVFVVLSGRVSLWNASDGAGHGPADETLGRGGLFGFSAMLTERSVGPRAVAAGALTVARIPGGVASRAFTSKRGARFLAESLSSSARRPSRLPAYSTVDDLVTRPALVVEPSRTVADVARLMTITDRSCAVVELPGGDLRLVTDATLRRRVIVDGVSTASPVSAVTTTAAVVAGSGESAAEALIRLFEEDGEFVVVAGPDRRVRGVVSLRDFSASSATADVSLHEQLRRAGDLDQLAERAQGVPALLGDLLSRGLASGRVIAVYATVLDAVIRRAIQLVLAPHEALSAESFTWLSLGSNGRREAVLSSDVDSAVAFTGPVSPELMGQYRAAFVEVHDLLSRAGFASDGHGATASRRAFMRTNDEWRTAARGWMADPMKNQGAMMTSLLVDGRPLNGQSGVPAVAATFKDLRAHPATMRLLLQDSLASRAKLRTTREALRRRPSTFDIKGHAILPVVNLARWAALSVGSPALGTTERLRAAAGSAMLPQEHADTLVEVFEVLQRLRLRYQLMAHRAGRRPSDRLTFQLMSPIDRSVTAQAVREVAAVQRRLANVSAYVPAEEWALPGPS